MFGSSPLLRFASVKEQIFFTPTHQFILNFYNRILPGQEQVRHLTNIWCLGIHSSTRLLKIQFSA